MFKTLIALTAALALPLPAMAGAATPAPTGPSTKVDIAFVGIEQQQGAVMFALFDSEAAYDSGKPVRGIRIAADAAQISRLIEGLPKGRYAIKSFQDVDGDGEMSTNPFGMPIEPFAFSNDAVGIMGPGKWADAAFDVKGPTTKISITITRNPR